MSAINQTLGPTGPSLLGPKELAAWRAFLRAHSWLTRELDAELVEAHGLQLTSYEVLLFLSESPHGRMRMSDLAEGVLLSRSGLSRLVDRLEREGFLERVRCEEDARGLYAAITEKGRRLFSEARRTHLEGVRQRFLRHFSEDELAALGELLERVVP